MSNEFNPDWRSPPGDTILDWMIENDISIFDFIVEIDISFDELFWLFLGITEIDQELANKLSKVVGVTPEFWLERERQYRL